MWTSESFDGRCMGEKVVILREAKNLANQEELLR
jgi:hypothetical protein